MCCRRETGREKNLRGGERMKKLIFAGIAGVLLTLSVLAINGVFEREPLITENEVMRAKNAWASGLISIGEAHAEGGDPRMVAMQGISALYDYEEGKVFFKPTLTHGEHTFRNTKDGALAYFVGGVPGYPGNGEAFALKGWTNVKFENFDIQTHGPIAVAMGHATLTGQDGNQVTVEKLFAYREDAEGRVRIIAHFSALPFDPAR